MAKSRLLVVGAGGHGRSAAEEAEIPDQFEMVGFLDDSLPVGEMVLGVPALGGVASMTDYRGAADQAIVAIGKKTIREKLFKQLSVTGFALATVVHPRAIVSPSAVRGAGISVMAAGTMLGRGVWMQAGAALGYGVRGAEGEVLLQGEARQSK